MRRRLIAAIVGAPLLGNALSACTSERPAKRPAPGDPPDPDARLRWRAVQAEHGLIVLHAAAIAKHPSLEELVPPVTARHRDHLKALLDDGPLPRVVSVAAGWRDGSASGLNALSGGELPNRDVPEVPDNADAALELLRDTERAASERGVAECLHAERPTLAALLASIAAAEAVHNSTLDAA